jgi:hypothetical protein
MKEVKIEWCPTKEMVADFMTKPLQGSRFRRLHDLIMGHYLRGESTAYAGVLLDQNDSMKWRRRKKHT